MLAEADASTEELCGVITTALAAARAARQSHVVRRQTLAQAQRIAPTDENQSTTSNPTSHAARMKQDAQ